VFTYLKAVTVPTAVFAASDDWGAAGGPDSGLEARVDVAADELADLVSGTPPARRGSADVFADPVPFEELLAR
jgi:FMN reductase